MTSTKFIPAAGGSVEANPGVVSGEAARAGLSVSGACSESSEAPPAAGNGSGSPAIAERSAASRVTVRLRLEVCDVKIDPVIGGRGFMAAVTVRTQDATDFAHTISVTTSSWGETEAEAVRLALHTLLTHEADEAIDVDGGRPFNPHAPGRALCDFEDCDQEPQAGDAFCAAHREQAP